ncbi:MAG: CPXCG motif-containing cysteine-rich protein [Gemmatimonadales bacterium]|nr:CPXCG motif-containing cysteine-rich protein [Gemmatimonadota bacterium]MCC7132968.1 CPXCG motif-containing cysteine-rich protein [Gemmatimonadales bacterium]MDX2061412.1 CPXCG motif-containing cysteine-rich protein [Gemmatimonadales bacterium]
MTRHRRPDDEDDDAGHLEETVEETCPHCGEAVTLAIDPSGGAHQEYVEDCEVCCRPWHVTVETGDDGSVSVTIDPS